MKYSLVYTVFVLLALSAIKLVFIVFQDTLGGWKLVVLSLVAGAFLSAFIWFICDRIHFFMAGFVGVFLAVILIQVLNHKYASSQFETHHLTVLHVGTSYVRYNSFDYLEAINSQGSKITIPNELGLNLEKGDNINILTSKGFWGLHIVQSISK